METLKLLPEQVETLNIEAGKLNEEFLKMLDDERQEERILPGCDMQGITDTVDSLSLSKLTYVRERIKTVNTYLNCYELVEGYDCEKISIGTEFTIFMDFGDNDTEKGTYRLVQANVCNKHENNYISVDCPLGNAVLNKKVGEQISYLTPNSNRVNGIILDILPEKTIEKAKEKTLV